MSSFIPTEELSGRARGCISSAENYITCGGRATVFDVDGKCAAPLTTACHSAGGRRSRRVELVGQRGRAVNRPQDVHDGAAVNRDGAIVGRFVVHEAADETFDVAVEDQPHEL